MTAGWTSVTKNKCVTNENGRKFCRLKTNHQNEF